MLRKNIPELIWFFDMEWVPDAIAARRLFDLPEETKETEAIERLWAEYGATDTKKRPFLKYLLSRVVSVAFLSRRIIFREGQEQIAFTLYSLPKLPVDPAETNEACIIE